MLRYHDFQVLHNNNHIESNVSGAEIDRASAGKSDTADLELKSDIDATWGDDIEIYSNYGEPSSPVYANNIKIFDGKVIEYSKEPLGPNRLSAKLTAEDSIFHKLKNDTWKGAMENVYVAVSETSYSPVEGVVNTIVKDTDASIDRSGIETIMNTANLLANDEPVFDLLRDLADSAYATFNVDVDTLHFHREDSRDVNFELTDSDFSQVTKYKEDWSEPCNYLFMRGGESIQVLSENTPFSSYTTISDGGVRALQFRSTRSKLRKVELYTRGDATDGNLRVRIQADDGAGNPINISDTSHDLQTARKKAADLQDGGWSTLWFQSGELGPSADFHAIIEASGTDFDIGVDSGDNLLYKLYYPFNIISLESNGDSIDKYGMMKDSHKNPDIVDQRLARDLAGAIVSARAWPQITISGTLLTHDIIGKAIGQRVKFTSSRFGFNQKRMRITDINETYEDNKLEYEITLEGLNDST